MRGFGAEDAEGYHGYQSSLVSSYHVDERYLLRARGSLLHILGFACLMLGESKHILVNGGLMVMNPMVQSVKQTHQKNKSKHTIIYIYIVV